MDITLAAGARNYFSRVLLALNVELDIPEGLSPELREALLAPLPRQPAGQAAGRPGAAQ